MITLTLNGSDVDLNGDEVIAVSYSIAPISDISSRNTAKSVSFNLPLTANNKTIIENSDAIISGSLLPYSFIPARLYVDGIDQKIEFAQIVSIKDEINIKLFGSNIDFFNIIKGKKLTDLDLSEFDHEWTLANAVASAPNTQGYIYAIIDYHADSPNTFIDNVSAVIDVRALYPSFFLHTLIDRIVTDAGFTADGDFLSNADYMNVIIPVTKFGTDRMRVRETFEFIAGDTLGLTEVIPLMIQADLAGVLLLKGSRITITGGSQRIVLEITEDFQLTASVNEMVGAYTVIENNDLFLYQGTAGGGDPPVVYTFTVGNTYRITMDLSLMLQQQDSVELDIGFLYDTIYPAFTSLRAFRFGYDFGSYITSGSLPDLKQSDLLKATARKFTLLIQADNEKKIVYFRQFSEIIKNIPFAPDWSEKVDYTDKPESQFDSGYSQKNNCVYQEDDTVVKPAGTDYILEIENSTLDAEKDLIKSPFAATEQVLRFGLDKSIANIKIFSAFDTAEQEIADVEPRILYKRMESFSPTLTYDDGTSTDTVTTAPLTHFIIPSQDFNLGFETNLVSLFSQELFDMLSQFRVVNLLLRLNAADINQLDFFTPVWIEIKGQPGCYFYISQIKQFKFTSQESTEVELVRLS